MKHTFLISYSTPSDNDKSISAVNLEKDSDGNYLLSENWSLNSPNNVSFAVTSGEYMYVLDENDSNANIHCFKLKNSSSPELIRSVSIPNAFGLCHLSVSEENSLLFASSYSSGHAAAFDISDRENPKLCFVHNTAEDVNDDSMSAKSHCMTEDPTHRFAFSVNIELDRIYSYKLENSSVAKNENFPFLQLNKGEGPRHILFHPLLPAAYCVTEYSNRLIFMDYSPSDGSLSVKKELLTLTDGFDGVSYGASLTMSRDCKYLYVSNRGENSIAVFSLDENGSPEKIQSFMLDGNWPRHICLTKDGKYMAVCQQKSGYVEILELENSLIKKSAFKIYGENPCFVCETDN